MKIVYHTSGISKSIAATAWTIVLLLFFISLPVGVNAQSISTYAGVGIAGFSINGTPATSSKISYPVGLEIDNSGNLLVCINQSYPMVRKIDAITKTIQTSAGSDTASSLGGGGDDGPATCAAVIDPYDVCVDGFGNLYVTDGKYTEVRKVDITTNIIDTFAGCRSIGNAGDGGPAKKATFNTLASICIDRLRNILYISSTYNYRVRKVDMVTGIITAFAGTGTNGYAGDNGPSTAADLSRVLGICLDEMGNLYIGDWDNGRIRRVDITTGVITSIAGTGISGFYGDGGPATAAKMDKPTAMCFDSCSNLYFCDENNHRVRKIDAATGIISTIAGTGTAGFYGDGGSATAAQFNHPSGIAIDNSGYIYVSDYYNHRIRRITPDTTGCYKINPSLNINKIISSFVDVYPNPATDFIHIDNTKTNATYRLLSMPGRVVQAGELKAGNNSIFIEAVPHGVYVLEVTDVLTGSKLIHKIIKQ